MALAIRAALGLALVVVAVVAAILALRRGNRVLSLVSLLAAGLVIGAGFNRASFLDINNDTSSLIMALLALAASPRWPPTFATRVSGAKWSMCRSGCPSTAPRR